MAIATTILTNNANDTERISRNMGLVSGYNALDSSYPAGGYALDLDGGDYHIIWDRTNGKIRVCQNFNLDSEVMAGTDLSAVTHLFFLAIGWWR